MPARAEGKSYRATVTRVTNVSPHMIRVTIGGPDLADFISAGPDEWVRLFLPQAHQQEPVLPTGDRWWELAELPEEARPIVRNYTIRRHHRDTDELDIEFVVHGDEGQASAWAGRAQPGDHLAIRLERAPYDPPADTAWQLIAGDETALPAIGSIVESMPAGTRALVYVEVPDLADIQELCTAGDVDLTWLSRCGAPAGNSDLLLDAVCRAAFPRGKPYVWLAGEVATVRTLRRHLVNQRGMDKNAICFMGYWRKAAGVTAGYRRRAPG